MKAVQIVKPCEVKLVDIPIPEIAHPDDVLIKVHYAGICGSDLHILHGSNPFATYPRVFGHEMSGEVAGVGTGVGDLNPGDHVILEPITYCGECYACTHGEPNVCAHLKVSGVHVDGAAAEYVLTKRRHAHKISKDVPWEKATLTEPLTIGSQACERGRVGKDDIVMICGAGTIGLCVLVNAILRGARCLITDIVDEKLEYAKKLGAELAVNVKNEDAWEKASIFAGEQGVNVFIDAVGSTAVVEQALEALSPAGRIVCLGFGTERISVPFLSITKKQAEIVGSRLQSGQFPPTISRLEKGLFPVDDFVSRVFPLDEAQAAFDYAVNNNGKYRKILIKVCD
ncbi:MAG: zinc-binding alcohol dehydrogenase family protein [Clostridia bacterium]|nr:zinc-binding alcohol dehydrogenase family protein [Clostridia bacterium]